MFSAVASGIFAVRNVDKFQNGDVGRSAVALGQTAGLVKEITKYNGAVADSAKSAVTVFSDLAKQNKAFEYASKATKFAADNVNPLICVSAAIKTAMSDDKLKTGITETAALSTMFLGESLVKNNYAKIASSQTVKNLLTKASNTKALKPVFEFLKKNNLSGKVGAIVKGLVLVAASISAYSIGQKIGDDIADNVKANLGKPVAKKIDQKA